MPVNASYPRLVETEGSNELQARESGSRCQRLRDMLQSNELEFILEAHNGISARLVEEAGFKGIWASGLALSAQYGVRDNNEASWTQIVEMLEFMSDVTTIPILLDGDTGYGNFNNMRRLVRKLEQRDIAGVCIEDKLFPKTNSFIAGERQPLAEIDEFCGKIKAGKDSQVHDEFNIVARVEALIAGWDVGEAIRRAEAYHDAGADAILIHSKKSRPDEILEFAEIWANRAPVVIVPTKYYSTPVQVYREAKISLAIWANHMLRAAVAAMQKTAAKIYESQSLIEVEDEVAAVNEIFRLQGAEELQQAEQRYFAGVTRHRNAIVLGASRGEELGALTHDKPKMMLPVNGKPLLSRLTKEFKRQEINDITVVAGYRADAINVPGIRLELNEEFEQTGEVVSLACAMEHIVDDVVICYGDLLFRRYILRSLLECEDEIAIVVDCAAGQAKAAGKPDFAYCSGPDDPARWQQEVVLEQIHRGQVLANKEPHGQWIGMLRCHGNGVRYLREAIASIQATAEARTASLADLLNQLVSDGRKVRVFYIHGHWLDVNGVDDLEHIGQFTGHDHD